MTPAARHAGNPGVMLTSTVCRYEHFPTGWYRRITTQFSKDPQLNLDNPKLPDDHRSRILHRKGWEFCAISEVLAERDMLRPGRTGLGSAVGQEPLPALFASYGASIVATDLMKELSSRP